MNSCIIKNNFERIVVDSIPYLDYLLILNGYEQIKVNINLALIFNGSFKYLSESLNSLSCYLYFLTINLFLLCFPLGKIKNNTRPDVLCVTSAMH